MLGVGAVLADEISEGVALVPFVVDFESEVCVPALPDLFRFLYSAIASASFSLTRVAIGDRTFPGFNVGKPSILDGSSELVKE